jgi:hypothetical protein
MPIQHLHFIDSAAYAPGFFDSFMGGLFLVKGLPLAGQLLWLLAVGLAVFFACREGMEKDQLWKQRLAIGAQACGWICFVLSFFFLLQPWDEVFINLRHSLNLARYGVFSFNAGQPVEGTVDWLVYFVLGWLHRLGLPLLELAFAQGLLGAITCICIARALWKRLSSTSLTLPTLLLCFYPPLAFNAAHGFATTWFAACILAAISFLFFADQPTRGLIALALLPLIRVEGISFAALLAALWLCGSQPKLRRRNLLRAFWVAVPFLFLSFWRWRTFCSVVPLPIQYKATGMNLFYFIVGMRNLVADLIACGTFVSLLALCFFARRQNKQILLGIQITVALALGSLPYYLAGGDWFPSYWGRYLLPFSIWCYLLALVCACREWKPAAPVSVSLAALAVVLLVQSLWPISSNWKFFDHFFSHRRTLAKIHPPTIGRGHYRIQNLSQLGLHLKATTDPGDVIGSSEVATIMYFADRETLDFLGVANPEIARSAVRQAPSLLREFPQESELPYLIFKRIRPDILPREMPAYLYTFDFMWRDQMPGYHPEELTRPLLYQAIDRWDRKLGSLIQTLYGGTDKILALGYEPVVVRYSNHFMNLYFVRADKLEDHLQRLSRRGFHHEVWHRP